MDADRVSAVGVNVGSQSSYPLGRGPIHRDGSFEYLPITERDDDYVDWPTYADLGYDKDLIEGSEDRVTHFDPEFPEIEGGEQYTFADPGQNKTKCLEKLSEGDYLFFYGTLDFEGTRRDRYWINDGWGGYVFGHFKLQRDPVTIAEYRNLPPEEQEPLSNNAHLRRPDQDENLVMILGEPEDSCLYDTAIPLSLPEQSLEAEEKRCPFLDSDGVDVHLTWYRGPLEFDEKAKEKLLNAHRTGENNLFGEELYNEPGFGDFDAELRSPSDFDDFRDFLGKHDLTEEQKLLAAFSYVSGGWDVEVSRAIVSDSGLGASNLSEATTSEELEEDLAVLFDRLHDRSDWPHGHRNNVPRNAGRQRDEGEKYGPYEADIVIQSLATFATDVDTSFTRFFDRLDDRAPFLDALTQIRNNVYSFQRLGAFDFLEVVVQTLGYDWLAPSQLRYEYVNSNGPRRGLEHVFSVNDFDTLSNRERCQCLTRLTAFACEERGMELADAIFAVESALCNCQKENRGTDTSSEDQLGGCD